MTVTHMVPKADPTIERVLESEWATAQLAQRLRERGVTWTEPTDRPLTHDEMKTIIRVIFRELRMRENAPEGSMK